MSSEATHRNILAIKQHSETTRKMFRDLELKAANVDTLINRLTVLEEQVRILQVKLYSGGASG